MLLEGSKQANWWIMDRLRNRSMIYNRQLIIIYKFVYIFCIYTIAREIIFGNWLTWHTDIEGDWEFDKLLMMNPFFKFKVIDNVLVQYDL